MKYQHNLGGSMSYVQPEIVWEKPDLYNDKWRWAICQPDAHWGEYKSGGHWNKEQAMHDAAAALSEVEYKLSRGLL
jgi:hypothetical protein